MVVVGNSAIYLVVVYLDFSFTLMLKKIIIYIFFFCNHLKYTVLELFTQKILFCHKYVCANIMMLTILCTTL